MKELENESFCIHKKKPNLSQEDHYKEKKFFDLRIFFLEIDILDLEKKLSIDKSKFVTRT